MIAEWLTYLSTPCLPYVRKMGYLSEAIAMRARHKRCHHSWQNHFQACQNAILDAASQCQQHRHLVVMGAGSLEDIPLAQLSQQFQTIYLVDLVFLKPAKQLAEHYANVTLIVADVSGILPQVFAGDTQLAYENVWQPDSLADVDMVVSLNLATQLPLIPVRWLMDRFNLDDQAADQMGKAIIKAHLKQLNDYSGVKCLIADRQITEYDAEGRLIDQFDPAWDVALPEAGLAWDWEVIPLGESVHKTRQINRVGASIWS
ncbi:hypothetical protein CYQ88_04040 [Hydrogenovibrio sp. SC-1]|uniref:hypothetical protein n=1 Tax=Hydrogenovibrio sp. SC-1 TaxID=2065820 RepID=UPI000C7CCA7F|nr:hypothetical protein [Hydrogenovibrio sp. SC-1]PLA74766.1 hypothetical protein CYQ88_04040 [Hydrogenovibrio sp. SC-1]